MAVTLYRHRVDSAYTVFIEPIDNSWKLKEDVILPTDKTISISPEYKWQTLMSDNCFHCLESVPKSFNATVEIDGKAQPMCYCISLPNGC